jgi:hypothetical protein
MKKQRKHYTPEEKVSILRRHALAVPAPRAAVKPSGRQQLIVATELRIAASDAEMPVPCFNPRSFCGPRRRSDEPFSTGGVRFRLSRDKGGSSRVCVRGSLIYPGVELRLYRYAALLSLRRPRLLMASSASLVYQMCLER